MLLFKNKLQLTVGAHILERKKSWRSVSEMYYYTFNTVEATGNNNLLVIFKIALRILTCMVTRALSVHTERCVVWSMRFTVTLSIMYTMGNWNYNVYVN